MLVVAVLLKKKSTGRQADALGAFRSARQTLVDELGVEPGPELRALESAILRQDDSLLLSAFFFSSRRRHTRSTRDWSSDVCSSDLRAPLGRGRRGLVLPRMEQP